MPDILPVSMQDILYSRKSDLREQKVRFRELQENKGERQRFFMTAALCMSKMSRGDAHAVKAVRRERYMMKGSM